MFELILVIASVSFTVVVFGVSVVVFDFLRWRAR